jgi:hypothetical protein
LSNHYEIHHAICSAAPLPKDMAAVYLANPDMSITEMADEYNLSPTFVRDHLLQGGVTAEQTQERRNRLISVKRAQKWMNDRRSCRNCSILIYKDRPVGDIQRDCDGYCSDCAGLGVKRITEFDGPVVYGIG